MSFLSKLSERVSTAFELSGHSKVLAHLNTLSDTQLEDLGFSRQLMSQGVAAYPWKENGVSVSSLPTLTETRATSKEIKEAIAELKAYNNRELEDIGISRYEIEEVVLNGRHDDNTTHAA
ncbi:DUF1127 domain-containing protein [Leucothrix sargassi]|nr:DUF1127 domain-containing protein [Leucothrix sargassi]